MDEFKVTLSSTDLKILESYRDFCDGLSSYLGISYEIVLHCLGNLDHSAIKVLNGFHTGRTEGAPITNLALTMLKKINSSEQNDVNLVYFAKNSNGEPMKSTTIPIHGEKGNIIGLMCINFYINTPFSEILGSFTENAIQVEAHKGSYHQDEIFSNNSVELISDTILKVRREVLEDMSISASKKNKEIITRLYENGFFNFKDSIPKCANILNISKNTVYLHLKKFR